jgi:transcriptional regulator with GAF, ATPase, and Fis domain
MATVSEGKESRLGDQTKEPPVWLVNFASRRHSNGSAAPVWKTLSLPEVPVVAVDAPPENASLGIILVDQPFPELNEQVASLSLGGERRILILSLDEHVLESDAAWQLLQAGAADVLYWDGSDALAKHIQNVFSRWRKVESLLHSPLVRNNLVGASRAWRAALRQVIEAGCFGRSEPVLLYGETGTGKELAARLIHTLDPQRSPNSLVTVDCTTIVEELSGSELFGHERGAFTGAVAARDGAFAVADAGTLFLDEVGELQPALQAQLLRVLQEHTYRRVGSNVWRKTDFRLVGATNRDLQQEMLQGRFRSDLYFRMASWTIRLPPLRERAEDILPLARHFLRQASENHTPPQLDRRVEHYLRSRPYPGNVRDLRNLVMRLVARHHDKGWISMGDIPVDERPAMHIDPKIALKDSLRTPIHNALQDGSSWQQMQQVFREVVYQSALDMAGHIPRKAAGRLGVSVRTVEKWRQDQGK